MIQITTEVLFCFRIKEFKENFYITCKSFSYLMDDTAAQCNKEAA